MCLTKFEIESHCESLCFKRTRKLQCYLLNSISTHNEIHHCNWSNIAGNNQTQKRFANFVTVRAFRAQFPIQIPQKGPSYYPKVSCFSFKYVTQPQKTKTTTSFCDLARTRPAVKFWVKEFIFPHKFVAPNFNQNYGNLKQCKIQKNQQ